MYQEINQEIKNKTTTRWKKGKTDDWTKYNKIFEETWKQIPQKNQNYQHLEQTIINAMEKSIGKITINNNKKQKTTNEEIKNAKSIRKKHKQKFREACQNNNIEEIRKTKKDYIESQTKTRSEVEKEITKKTKQQIDKLIEQGGTNSNMFWNIRKKLMGKGGQEEYDTITEDNIKIKDPITTKNHKADYFEDLYQAREAESTHVTWTKTINEKIKQITKTNSNETLNEITLEELNKNIKTLKRGKSTGPDNIPNEAIIEANKTNRTAINNILNNIYNTEKIPDQWQKGEIIRFYKGKGKKGKCSNERGITLGSNMGKLFERIINNRISKVVNISEAQAGGQKGKATADHLLILNTIIQTHKNKNKNEDLYIAFLDVTKAYDKAWLNAILYALYNSGLTGKDWNILKHINKNPHSHNKNTIWEHKNHKNLRQHKTRRSTVSNRVCQPNR